MQELMKHCVAAAISSTSDSDSDEVAFSGTLMKKGGGTSKVGRRNWNPRYLEVRARVLYYYAALPPGAPNGSAAGKRPLGSMALSTAEVDASLCPHLCPHLLSAPPLRTSQVDSTIAHRERKARKEGRRAHYFEVRCKQSGQVMKLAARNADDRAMWIHVLP